jgi:hypothetical protein
MATLIPYIPPRRSFQSPGAKPFVLPLSTRFPLFLTASISLMAAPALFLSTFPPACLADEASSLPDRILWKTVTVWRLLTLRDPAVKALFRSAKHPKMASTEQKVRVHMI